MKPTCYMLFTALSVIVSESSGYKPEKYGCLEYPNICVPPEDCSDDGFAGNCQIPHPERGFDYQKNIISQSPHPGGSVVGYREFRDVLVQHWRDNWDREYLLTASDIGAILLALEDANDKDKVGEDGDDTKKEYRYIVPSKQGKSHQEYRRSAVVSDESNPRYERMKVLVEEAKQSLARRGERLSDLSADETDLLARYLAKVLIMEDNGSQPSTDTKNQETYDFDDPDSSPDELVSVKSIKSENDAPIENILPVQESPAGMENLADFVEELPQVPVGDIPPDSGSLNLADESPVNTPKSERKTKERSDTLYIVIIVVGATVLLIILVTIISCIVHTYRTNKRGNKRFIGNVSADETQPFGEDYQELCRQHYASKNSDLPEDRNVISNSTSTVQDPLITHTYPSTKPNNTELKRGQSGSSSNQPNATRKSSVSSVSWSEEPVTANLDITTGHAVLSYMEDHLNNKGRLDKEWEEICGYEADSITTAAAVMPQNSRKNRSVVALPYDHNRIKLSTANNHLQSDYINASAIIDNDPKRPLYIAAQGPLPSTIPDFWQMMWEQDCVAIVMLTPLVEEGVNQCARYWPDEGSCTYHNFEIHLVSEHIWCEDYLVRSLYLKHLGTGETRTVTQFHFLSWPKDRVPSTPKPLLELRRKVTKCYKGHNSPVLVHCSDGVGRTGTYILLDLAIDRMLKGAKEIDIAATLEHIRDQRVGMVAKKEQFEFALTAVAEEVNAILKSLLH